jgi:hypothetical protein
MHGACNVPVRQSKSAEALLVVHLIGDAGSVQTVWQLLRTGGLCEIDTQNAHRIAWTGSEVLF